ncbi:hypothetical protein ABG79_00230 [Caloramator mitchellensis]|uniref:Uncharacterized protein n=1 Tax=Caloramator mitchellensis TaxID=908809 RepID=A0A0R3K6K9_CALMK|nr:hypothetical protein [Caloramator mitchellensis]KRQ88063.1 hypothetical protein ABG79_00230 [Caloramator mitchellensis]
MYRKGNLLDNTTFEFLKPGWIAIHLIGVLALFASVAYSCDMKRKYLS